MASVYLKRDTWYLRYRNAAGRWVAEASVAGSKTEARRLAEDLERKAERERKGLEKGPGIAATWTVKDLFKWWLESYAPKGSLRAATGAIKKHVTPAPIASMVVAQVGPGDVEQFLHERSSVLAPKSVNHLRGYVPCAFSSAREAGLYRGQNPVDEVKKRRVPRRAHDYLRHHEVAPVLDALSDRWRPMFATAIYTGLRKGELAALQKSDVDIEPRLLTVQRSWERDTTKGGHADVIPIAKELVPYLRAAIKRSPSDLVFPGLKGEMLSEETKLGVILRRALRRAGIVSGFTHKCRLKGCGHQEKALDEDVRRCPKDGRKLWPCADVRPIRFHDLRHTAASLLMMAGANPAAVQRIMRHSDPRITTEVYGHLAPGYLRAEVDRLTFGARKHGSAEAPAPSLHEAKTGSVCYPVATGPEKGLSDADRPLPKSNVIPIRSTGSPRFAHQERLHIDSMEIPCFRVVSASGARADESFAGAGARTLSASAVIWSLHTTCLESPWLTGPAAARQLFSCERPSCCSP